MLSLAPAREIRSIVCLGAHPDDIEIGCSGTLRQWVGQSTAVQFVVFASDDRRTAEANESAQRLFDNGCDVETVIGNFADGLLPSIATDAKRFLIDAVGDMSPDLVFAPSRDDLHQDHRFVGELALQFFRDQLILEYEIPKYDGDLGQPNLFVPLSADAMDTKIRHLLDSFESQRAKHWYREDVFRAMAILRGVECRADSGFAEAFFARKVVTQ